MRSSLRKLGSFWGLGRADRLLFLEAAAGLVFVVAALRLVRMNALLSFLNRRSGFAAAPESVDWRARVGRTRQLLQLAVQHGPCGGNCLSRSITLWWLLRRQGIPSDLRIGVRKDNERFEAHAWVEHGGVALDERREIAQVYAPFGETIAR